MNTITPNPALGLADSLRSKGFSDEDIGRLEHYADAIVEKQIRHVIHQELVPVNERLTKVEQKMTKVDERLTKVDERITNGDERITKVEERLTKVEQEMTKGFAQVDVRFAQVDMRFVEINTRIDKQSNDIHMIQKNLSRMTWLMISGFVLILSIQFPILAELLDIDWILNLKSKFQ